MARGAPRPRSPRFWRCITWLCLLTVMAAGIVAGARHGGDAAVTVEVFYNEGCADCDAVRKDRLLAIGHEMGVVLGLRYHDIADAAGYERLVRAEELRDDTGNELPVVVVGDRLLGGVDEFRAGFRAAVRAAAETDDTDGTSEGTERPPEPGAGPTERENSPVHVAYFYRPGCAACRRADHALDRLARRHDQVHIERLPTDERDNLLLLEAACARLDVPSRKRLETPAIVVGRGRLPVADLGDDELESRVLALAGSGAGPWWRELDLGPAERRLRARWRSLTVGAVVVGGLLDGINPCAFATLVLFVSMATLSARRRRRLLAISVSFIAGVFCTYLLIGLGLSTVSDWLAGVPWLRAGVNYTLAGACLLLAAASVYDAVRARRGARDGMLLKLPERLRHGIRSAVARFGRARYLAPAGFLTGAVISGLELVCTGQVYLPVIQLMNAQAGSGAAGVGWLLLYNLSFVTPLVAVFLLVYGGTTSEQLASFLKRHLGALKVAGAGLFLALAVLLVVVT